MPKSLKVAFYISIVLAFLRRIRRKVLDGRALAALKLWDEAVKNWNKDHGCFVAPLIPKWVEPYLPEERVNPEELEQLQREEAEYYYGNVPAESPDSK